MFVVLIVVSALLVYFWFKHKFSFWEKRGFMFVPPKIPMGTVGEMNISKHSSEVLKKYYDDFKGKTPAVGMYFLTQPVLMPLEPELVKDILVRNFDSFHDRGFYSNPRDDPLSAHLFFLEGQAWKDMRTKLSPTFTSGKMKMMFGQVSSICDRMVDFVKPTNEVAQDFEMKETLSSFTTEVISSVAFGLETKCLGNPKNEFRTMANRVFDPPWWENIKVMFMLAFQELAKFLRMSINAPETTKFFTDVITSSLKYREQNNIQRNDFLQLLIQIKNSEAGLSMNEIAANSFVFFLAGFETSSSVATFALYELAINEDIQEKLRQENEDILTKYDGEVTYEAIMEMKYLDMVFNETLRKYPVVDTQFRQSSKDFKIPNSDLTIPKGVMIIFSSQALHHDERFYENPSKFDPERFTEENVKTRHPFAYIPFSKI